MMRDLTTYKNKHYYALITKECEIIISNLTSQKQCKKASKMLKEMQTDKEVFCWKLSMKPFDNIDLYNIREKI